MITIHRRLRRPLAATAVVLALVAGLSACGSDSTEAGASGDSAYPMTLQSPFGETTLKAKPEKVAVVSDVDLDIAVALGVDPVIAPLYSEIAPYTQAAADAQGFKIETYDPSDGTDFAAIAEAEPDVILATSGYTLQDDFEQLSKIAPIVSFQGEDGLTAMTWQERTDVAAAALGAQDRAAKVKADVAAQFAKVAEANPDFKGKTYTQVTIHPTQITYASYTGADTSFFTDLGFVQAPTASDFSAQNEVVSKENLDELEADVLFIGYPFGDEGLLTRDDLESDRLFRSLDVVKNGHYGVIEADVASPLSYKTPLSLPWVLERMEPVLQGAVTGNA